MNPTNMHSTFSNQYNEPFVAPQPTPQPEREVHAKYVESFYGDIGYERNFRLTSRIMKHKILLKNCKIRGQELFSQKILSGGKVGCSFIGNEIQHESPCLHTNAVFGMYGLSSRDIYENRKLPMIVGRTDYTSYKYNRNVQLSIGYAPAYITVQQIIINMLLYRGRSKMILKLKSADPSKTITLILFAPSTN